MTRYFLKKIEIEGFRGINNQNDPFVLDLKTDCINSVFAGNATGKSSTFEAICFAIKGEIPKLSKLPVKDRPDEYYLNKFNSNLEAKILLVFSPDDGSNDVDILVVRGQDGTRTVSSQTHKNPEVFLKSLDDDIVLLDHESFHRFIEDSPLQRGRTFSSLLGLSKLSEYRQVLESLSSSKNLDSDFDGKQIQRNILNLESQLSQIIVKMQKNYLDITGSCFSQPVITEDIVKNSSEALSKLPLLSEHFDNRNILTLDYIKIKEVISTEENGQKSKRLWQISEDLKIIEKLAPEKDEIEEIHIFEALIIDAQNQLLLTKGVLFEHLYEVVSKILCSNEWSDDTLCPACDSKNDGSLKQRIAAHLEKFNLSSKAFTKVAESWAKSVWVGRLKKLYENSTIVIDKTSKTYGYFDTTFRSGRPTQSTFDEFKEWAEILEGGRDSAVLTLQSEKEQIEKIIPPSLIEVTAKIITSEQLKENILQYNRILQDLAFMRAELEDVIRWKTFISNAADIFSEAENCLSSSITMSLKNEYSSLYQKITNNPEIVPTLEKDLGTENLHLRLSNFYGLKDLSATALLSESYRNALAISIFLSATLQSKAMARFILLDDVTSSFDSGHQFNLMEILRTDIAFPTNLIGPQIIIFSHDGLLEKYFDTLSNTSGWHHQKLQGLPPIGSIVSNIQGSNRIRTRAEDFLKAGMVDQASPLVRQYMEFKLLEIIRKVGILVPIDFSIRDDKKMIQNALEVIKTNVELYNKSGTL